MREQKDRYEIFLKVCETGSFSKAAEALNYTQSGISQMMAGLEEELGVQLFARINRGVTLTDNGTRLLPYIRELANQKTRLRRRRSTSTTRWRANCGWAAFPASQRSGCRKSCTISRSITRR